MITLHASALSDLFDCPYRFYTKNIEKIRLPSTRSARLGTSVHEGAACFDQAKLDGREVSIDDAVGVAIDRLYRQDEEIDWGDSSAKETEPVVKGLTTLYCSEISPQFDFVAVEARCEHVQIADLDIALVGTVDRIYQDNKNKLGIADLKIGKNAVKTDLTVKTNEFGIQMGVYEIIASMTTGLGLPCSLSMR